MDGRLMAMRLQSLQDDDNMATYLEWVGRVLRWIFMRPSLKIRVIDDDPYTEKGGLKFEVENTSRTPTSLAPTVTASFLYPRKGQYTRGTATFDLRDLDRELPPFKPRIFTASARALPAGYGHAWFRVYRFRPRRGVLRRVRIRNVMLEPLSLFRFWFELWRFRLLGRVVNTGPMTLARWEAIKRSQGPH